MKDIEAFFHEIGPEILELVRKSRDKNSVVNQKGKSEHSADFATETDVEVERHITSAINQKFPNNAILAEEENTKTSIDQPGRIWIIDPICGTSNFARGIQLYVSNIALAENGKLIASCVVDHSSQRYFWSTGNGVNDGKNPASIARNSRGTIIDIDLGALISAPQPVKDHYAKFVERISRETDITCMTLNSSLPFLLAAIGTLDAFVNPFANLWDRAAAIFLMQQAGGIVTDFDGKPWDFDSKNAVGALDPKVHAMLITYLHTQ